MTSLASTLRSFTMLSLLMAGSALNAQQKQEDDARLPHIQKLYAATESALKSCTTTKREIEGQSTEGGELTAYLRKNTGEVLKLEAIYYGESGKASEEYYLEDGHVAFILRTDSTYDKPLSGMVKSKTEERLYFAKGELIKWLDETNKDVPLPSPTASERAKQMLASAKSLMELARNPAAK